MIVPTRALANLRNIHNLRKILTKVLLVQFLSNSKGSDFVLLSFWIYLSDVQLIPLRCEHITIQRFNSCAGDLRTLHLQHSYVYESPS